MRSCLALQVVFLLFLKRFSELSGGGSPVQTRIVPFYHHQIGLQ